MPTVTMPALAASIIYAIAREISLGNRTALYEVRVEGEDGELVAHFKGTVFRKDEEWK